MRDITEEKIEYLLKKYGKMLFPELEKNLCIEHYNDLHKTNFTEKDIELNQSECWLCKEIKDRP